MPVLLSIFFGFVPMFFFAAFVYWLDRYEKEPKILLGGVFIWGAIIAAGAAFIINTVLGMGVYLFTNSEAVTDLTTGSLIAPVIEESLKGLAVLGVFLVFRREFDSLLDGIIYAAVTALGFAATENAYYIYHYGYEQDGYSGLLALVFIRVILVGWQHPFYTAFIGIGLAAARLNRRAAVRMAAPVLGWCVAVFTHAVHNTLAHALEGAVGLAISTMVDWSGWLFMLVVIALAAYNEQRYIAVQLREEVGLGLISPQQYRTACSALAQSMARLSAALSGRWRATNAFYQLTAELAHKKHQRGLLGDEGGNSEIIQRLRAELASLATHALS